VYALNLVMGLGLGFAIDHTLFLVTRFREELGTGAETRAALRRVSTMVVGRDSARWRAALDPMEVDVRRCW
jgi:uncharacterized membrane protein YdfJ with MMPL/SSD domain